MAREPEKKQPARPKLPPRRARAGDPAWSAERAPFHELPPEMAAPLRDELSKAVASLASDTRVDIGAVASPDPANRRGGPRSPDVARSGLVPSPLFDEEAVRAMVVECVRLAGRLLESPLAVAAPAAYELAAVRDVGRVLSTYVAARRRAQVQAVRASALTALATVYQEHCRSWPVAVAGAKKIDPKLESDARAKMLAAVRAVLKTPVYRGVVGDVDDFPPEALVRTPRELSEQADRGGAVKVAAEVLENLSGTSAHAFQNARKRPVIEISRDLWPATLSLPHVSLAPTLGNRVAAEAGEFVVEVFRSRLAVEPGDFVEYGISTKPVETPEKPRARAERPRAK